MRIKNKKDPPKNNKKVFVIKSLIFPIISLFIALSFPVIINKLLQNSIVKNILTFTVIFVCTISCFEYLYHFIFGKDFIGIKNLLPWNRKSKAIKSGFDKTEEIINELETKIKKENKGMENLKIKVKAFWEYLKLHCGAFIINAGIIVSILLAVLSSIEDIGITLIVKGHNILPIIGLILTGLLSFLKDGTLPIFKSNEKTKLLKEDCWTFNENVKTEKEKSKQEAIAKQKEADLLAKANNLLAEREAEKEKAKQKADEMAQIESLANKIEAERKAKIEAEVNGVTTITSEETPQI